VALYFSAELPVWFFAVAPYFAKLTLKETLFYVTVRVLGVLRSSVFRSVRQWDLRVTLEVDFTSVQQ
jgi:hypothetical protein